MNRAPVVEGAEESLLAERRVAERLRQLLVEGFRAPTAMQAAVVVASVVCEHLGADRGVVLYFTDEQRTRVNAATVGVPAQVDAAVQVLVEQAGRAKVRPAGWARAATSVTVLAVDDVAATPDALRPGGVGHTLGLASFLGIPLVVDDQPVGRVTCGFGSPHRWNQAERDFASRAAVEASAVLEAARLRDAERAARHELEYRATHDWLTGLLNRGEFERRLTAAVDRRQATEELLAVLLLDLDGFKAVNDTLGHPAGDRLLTQAAGRIRSCVRDGDVVARLGGDEFAVVLPAATASDTTQIATRIAAALAEPFTLAGHEARIGASIGVAYAPDHAQDAAALLGHADTAMYQAKRDTRGRSAVHAGARALS